MKRHTMTTRSERTYSAIRKVVDKETGEVSSAHVTTTEKVSVCDLYTDEVGRVFHRGARIA